MICELGGSHESIGKNEKLIISQRCVQFIEMDKNVSGAGYFLLKIKENDLAMTAFEEIEGLNDQELWDRLSFESGVGRARVLYEISKRTFGKKDYSAAQILAEESRNQFLDYKEEASCVEIADSYMAIAINAQELKNYERVMANTKQAISYYQESGLKYNNFASEMLVDAFENLERYEDAITELQTMAQYMDIDQETGDLTYLLIKISENYRRLNKFQDALTMAQKAKATAISKKSENQVWYIEAQIAENLFELGELNKSLEKLTRVVDVFSLFGKNYQEVKAKLFIARIKKAQGRTLEARAELENLTIDMKSKGIEDNSLFLKVENEVIDCLEIIGYEENKQEIEMRKRRIKSHQSIVEGVE
jgi:tetratricopeptide (TPR) repeat protein